MEGNVSMRVSLCCYFVNIFALGLDMRAEILCIGLD